MKKIIPILLTLLLMVGLMPISAFAADEKSETFICDGETLKVEGENFNLSAERIEEGGWSGGSSWCPLTITARDDGIRITHIDAHVNYYGYLYNMVGVNRGRKVPESLGFATTGDVSVLDINYRDFSFSNGDTTVPFDKITVYFETCEEDGHFYGSDNVCVGCGLSKCETEGHSFDPNNVCVNCKLSKCEIEGHHSFDEDNMCSVCGLTKCEIEGHHSFGEDNVCGVCGLTKCDVEGHAYEKGVCTVCQHECENEFHNGVYVCPDCLMEFDPTQGNPLVSGSTLSDGNMTIIFTIAALAIGLCGGFVIGRKKKPTPANVVGNDEE